MEPSFNDRMDRFEAAIERLLERQEGFAQGVELIRSLQADSERRIATILAIQQDAENIRALARVAEMHERRLSDLEGQE